MKRLVLTAIVLCVWWGTVQPAHAQFIYTPPQTSPFYRPPVSPYLNVLRGGPFGAATGYYTITRPQIQAFGQIQALQSDLLSLQQGATLTPPPLGTTTTPGATGVTTGHPVTFFNYGRYYAFPNAPGRLPGR